MNPKVDFYFAKEEKWQEAISILRKIVLDCGLTEALKWGSPCYTLAGANVVLIHVFKDYCALLFFKGALLKNTHGLLIQPTENVQAARQIRFTTAQEIPEKEGLLKAAILEAVAIEKAGLKVELKKTTEFATPEEFQQKLAEMPHLQTAFDGLTPGRQRACLIYFAAPKQTKTRQSRIDKYISQILDGKGLND